MPIIDRGHLGKQYSVEKINHVHGLTEEGLVYMATHKFSAVSSGGGTEEVLFSTGDTEVHVIFLVKGDGYLDITKFENTTVSANGTEIDSFNLNRTSDKTPDSSVYHTPTIDSDGDALFDEIIPAAGGNKAGGGNAQIESGLTLEANTNYLIRITNPGTADRIALTKFEWHE